MCRPNLERSPFSDIMSAVITVDDIVQELSSIQSYVDARTARLGASATNTGRLVDSIIVKLNMLPSLSIVDAPKLTTAIPHGALCPEACQRIVACIDEKLITSATRNAVTCVTAHGGRKANQLCVTPWLYFNDELKSGWFPRDGT